MIKGLEKTITFYMIICLPLLFSVGRFVPYVETIATLLSLVVLVLNQINKRRHFILRIVIVVLFVLSGMMGSEYSIHIDHIKPMIIIFLALDAVGSDLYEYIVEIITKNEKFIMQQIVCILFANIIFIFLDAGYSTAYQDSWSFSAYQGIFSDPHQCAYHICALLILVLFIAKIHYKSYYFWVLMGFEYCVLLTGARAPTVLALILALVFVVDNLVKQRYSLDARKKALRYFVLFICIIGALYLLMKYTNFGLKMVNSMLGENLDNGRGTLRDRDWTLFVNSDLIHKLFGHGSDAVIDYHASFKYSAAIWSHNDFFQILVGMGLIMFCIYTYYWLVQLKCAVQTSILYVVLVACLIFVAFYNGLYIHTRFTFLMPVLFGYMRDRKSFSDIYTEKYSRNSEVSR